MSILVATHFSPCSRTAMRLAAALAHRRGVPLCLVHAVAPLVADYPPQLIASTGWETEMGVVPPGSGADLTRLSTARVLPFKIGE